MADMPRSCRSMWVLLSGSTVLKSEDYITTTLNQNRDKIVNGILFFRDKDAADYAKELEAVKKEYSELPPETISRICDSLDLSPKQALDLFLSFLSYEYTGSSKSIANSFACDKNMNALLSDLSSFYLEERLFSLFCLKEILSNWKFADSRHPYRSMFAAFVETVKESEIISSLTEQLKFLCKALTDSEMIYDTKTKWFEEFTRERFELVQLLILMFSQTQPSIDQIIQLIQIFDQMKFLICRHNSPPDHSVSDILEAIPLLESVLVVMCLNLSQMQEKMDEDGEIPLLRDESQLRRLDQLIRDRGQNQVTSAILHLAWVLVRSWHLPAFELRESEGVVTALGSAALNADVFQVLANFLKSLFFETYIASSRVGTCVKLCIGSLVNVLFSIFSMEKMVGKKQASLFELMKQILTDDHGAELALSDEESGLFSVIKSAELLLSKDPAPYFELAAAVCSTSSSHLFVVKAMELSGFVESLPNTSNQVVWCAEDGCYMSRIDRLVYLHESSIHLKRGATANILSFNKEQEMMDLLWSNVSFNAFALMRDMYSSKLEFVSSGFYNYLTDEPSLHTIQLIHGVCQSVLTTCVNGKIPYEVREIVKLSMEGIKLFARLPRIPRLYVSTAFSLITAFVDLNKREAAGLWDLLRDVDLLPYISGTTNDIALLLKGNQVNSSEIGRRLVQDECTLSSYELCLAFLQLVHTIIQLIEPDEQLLASVTFIFTEVFPFYHLWHYKRNDHTDIGFYCYSIAHKIVSKAAFRNPMSGKIHKLAEAALVTKAGGESLLKTIQCGSKTVANAIKATGVGTSLWHRDVFTVRLALSVLQQLFKNKESADKQETGERELSVVEQAFLSANESSGRKKGDYKEESNMLIILTGYVYQPFDFRITVLSVQTLKRLAKSFPMSMLACLGSAADAIKEHFLFRLESLTEDIRVKVALLDFLSACVQYQPGLMELFVNVESDKSLPDDESNSVLQVVLDILKEKKEAKFYCPNELHIAAVRFLSTFWIKSNFLTITCLKKSNDLWSLVCFPLLPDGEDAGSDVNERLFSFIVKLISREIFLQSIDREPLDPQLDSRLKRHLIIRMTQLSDNLRKAAEAMKIEKGTDSCLLLSAWRDLLTTMSIYEPVPVQSDLRRSVVMNLLGCLKKQIEFRADPAVLAIIADSSLITFKKWSADVLLQFEEWIEMTSQLIYLTNEAKDELDSEFLITMQVLTIKSIEEVSRDEQRIHHLVSWFPPVIGLLQHSIQMLVKAISDKRDLDAEAQKLMKVCLSLFNSLMTASAGKASSWLHVIRSSSLIESLSTLLQELIQLRKDPELPAHVILLFIAFACIDPVADSLIASSRDDLMWVSCVLKSEPVLNETTSRRRGWENVYILTIRLLTSLLATRSQFFVRDILQLMTVNLDRLTSCLRAFRTAPTREIIEETAEVMKLVRLLVRFKNYWFAHFQLSFEVLMSEASLVACSATAFVVRPTFFNYMLQHPHSQKPLYRALLSRMNPNATTSLHEGARHASLTRSQPASSSPTAIDSETENQLILILSLSTQILAQALPSLSEVLANYQLAAQDPQSIHRKPLKLHLTTHFTTPAVEAEHVSSFGSVLQVLNMYVRKIQKTAAGTPSSDSPVKSESSSMPGSMIMTTIEAGLCLLVSQAFIAQVDPDVKASDKQFIVGELKSELHTILSPLSRQSKRASSSVFPGASSLSSLPSGRSPSHSFSEYPLIKFLVDEVLEDIE